MEIFALTELLQNLNPQKDWMDVLSALSVPILSLFALIITVFVSMRQNCIMKHEYRLKLYPERWKIYKYLVDLHNDLQRESEIVGDKYKIALINIEKKMFLYNTRDIDDKYKDLICFINSTNIATLDFNKEHYLEQVKTKLSLLINELKIYLSKHHLKSV